MQTKPFSNNLREFRKRACLRQIDVARELQLDCADRLSRWENGSAMPNIVNLFKLASLYKVQPQEVYPELYSFVQCSNGTAAPNAADSLVPMETCEK